jgi:hypothetical protein
MIFCCYKSAFDEEFIVKGTTTKKAFQELSEVVYPRPKLSEVVFYTALKINAVIPAKLKDIQ